MDRCPHHLHLSRHEEARCHHVLETIDNGEHTICPKSKRYVTVFKPAISHSSREINSFTVHVRFRCTSGCRGGIDRRSILTLNELYVNKVFKGRAVIEVSVCSSPGRDRENQEKKGEEMLNPILFAIYKLHMVLHYRENQEKMNPSFNWVTRPSGVSWGNTK